MVRRVKKLESEYRIKQSSQVSANFQTLKPRLRLEASTTGELVRGISKVRASVTLKETDKGEKDYNHFIFQLFEYILPLQEVKGLIPSPGALCDGYEVKNSEEL